MSSKADYECERKKVPILTPEVATRQPLAPILRHVFRLPVLRNLGRVDMVTELMK
jgi:hypothetical protein